MLVVFDSGYSNHCTKRSVKVLDDCFQRAVSKIFKVNARDNIAVIRRNCDLPYIGK